MVQLYGRFPPRRSRMLLHARSGLVLVALVSLLGIAGCSGSQEAAGVASDDVSRSAAAGQTATFVGRSRCASCHQEQDTQWQGSHHDRAMQEATGDTVLGDFRDRVFTYAGVTTRFSTRDGRFVVRTDGPDGSLQDFEVAYVFGVYPLQQYLVGFPDGRYQALSIAWDSRPRADGGQRWFHLYPDERVTHADPLHWTAFSQNWNAQCAVCHSTNLRKGYDRAGDAYRTTWSEIDVSCEQCHGPASAHVRWAEHRRPGDATDALTAADMGIVSPLRERRGARWTMQLTTGIARRSAGPDALGTEVGVCAPCHARRAERFDAHVPGRPFLESYRPSLLSEGLYHPDGQVRDEVYEYGSFVQSRMYAAGVTCSDCHDPHSLKLRAERNGVCAPCHLPSRFDAAAHHGHQPGTPGASCVACHMPAATFMVVDRRHDHGFRVPRPDLTAVTGARDACTQCHTDRTPAWAAAALDRWKTPTWRARPQFAETFAAARQGRAAAMPALTAIARDARQPGIVRATAVELLQVHAPAQLEPTLDALAAADDPLVRLSVAQALPQFDPAARARVGGRLLQDPLRAIRVDAAAAVDGDAAEWLPAPQRRALTQALGELQASDVFNGDRPESYVSMALRAERAGDLPRARSEYEAATRYAPWFLPPYVNLSDVQRRLGDEAGAERTLRRGLSVAPDDSGLLYALGLSLHRQQRTGEATDALRRAAQRSPDIPRYPFAYALALEAQSRIPDALTVIDAALERHPDDRDLLDAGLGMARKVGDEARARAYVRGLLRIAPDDPSLAALARRLGVM